MTKLNSYLSLIRFYNPIGFWLLLWPGLWGLFLSDNFNIENFTIAVSYTHLRAKNRPIASKKLSLSEAGIFIILLASFCIFLLMQTNPYTIKLVSYIAIPMIILYPLMKRFLAMPQLFLGATFGLSLPISYSIAESTLSLEVIFLYIGCIFWIIAYDTYYALCDLDDDKKLNLNSSAIFFGKDTQKAIILFSMFFFRSNCNLCHKKLFIDSWSRSSISFLSNIFSK